MRAGTPSGRLPWTTGSTTHARPDRLSRAAIALRAVLELLPHYELADPLEQRERKMNGDTSVPVTTGRSR